jgi:beta-N-acetylhexosaminidase
MISPSRRNWPNTFQLPITFFFATRNANQSAWRLKFLSTVARLKNVDIEVIVVSTCTPYDLLNTGLGFDFPFAYIATFELTPSAWKLQPG